VGTRPLLAFGANLTASSFVYSLAGGADSLLIGRFYGAAAVGFYSRAGALLRRPLDQFLAPINAVFIPVLSRVQSQPERYRRTFIEMFEAVALAGFFFSGVCLALSRPLTLVLLGGKWEAAAPIVAAFTVGALATPLVNTCSWLLESQGRGSDALKMSSIITAISLLSFLVGMPFGAVGVATAYCGSTIALQLPVFFHISGGSGPVRSRHLWNSFLRLFPVWIVAGIGTLVARLLLSETPPWLQLAGGASIGTAIAAGFVFVHAPSRRSARQVLSLLRDLRQKRR
jgi:PST family polysaccharide transporter